MSILNMAKNIKQVHPKFVICYRTGRFYAVFGKDTYILSGLFDYKVTKIENDILRCGFPTNSKNKVMTKLEDKKINYIFLDVKNNYEVEDKLDNKNLNNYDEILEDTRKLFKTKQSVENILEKLKQQINKPNFTEKIRKIEEIINEN